MKTFKVAEPRKLVAWSLVVMFSLLQIVPTGWAAARPAEELQARGVPASVDALAKPVKAVEPVASMQRVPTFVDSTAFQLNENPLSPATPEPKSEQELIPYTPPVEVQVQPQIPTTPPIVIDVDKAVPAPVKVVTDPSTGKELSVSVNDRGIATVKWGDQEYKGYFDAATNSVHVITNDDSIWTLQFAAKEDGSLYLQSFHSSFWSSERSSDETYTFNAQGQLIRKDWNKTDSIYTVIDCVCVEGMSCDCPQGGASTFSSGGTIDYVTVNGKTLMSHEKSWSESSGLIVRWGGRSDSESWYSYDAQGNLAAKSWETKNDFGSSYGQETYVQISGKTLLSSSKVWQYNNLRIRFVLDLAYLNKYEEQLILDEKIRMPFYISSHTETFYAYDAEGNLVSELSATEGYDYNNVRHTRGTLWTRDADKNTWALISAEGIDPFKVWFRQDASEIKALAQRMTVYVSGNEERYNYTHRVEYTRNSDGSMTAKAVYDNAGNVSIVQGEPDILSNETNDITFRNGQQVNGYTVYYQEYGHEMKPGWFNDGYRLVFYDSNWNATAVDFPAQNTVVLNGIENKITIDPDGILALQEVPPVIPPAVQTYVDALQSAVGSRYTVNVFRQESGMYLISVGLGASCQPVCKVVILPKLGEMEGMSFNISADGKPDVSTLVVAYNVLGISREDALRGVTQPAVDAQLLYEVLQQLMDRVHPILVKPLPVIPAEPKDPELLSDRLRATLDPASIFNMIDQVLIAMTHITVTAVTEDGAIHFTKDGVDYKCYRDLTGNVIVERALPSAVQAYVDQLQGALGEGFEVIADAEWGDKGDGRVYNGFYLIRIVNKYPKPGALDVLEFETDSNGVMVKGSVFAVYGGVPQVDSQLLYAALIQLQHVYRRDRGTDPVLTALPLDRSDLAREDRIGLPEGPIDLEFPMAKIDKILIQMTQILVTAVTEDGAIHFVKDGMDYKCYRDAEGNVIVEKALPPAVQEYVVLLQSQLGDAFKIDAVRRLNGQYQVTATAGSQSAEGLQQIMFYCSAEGLIDPLHVSFANVAGHNLYQSALDQLIFDWNPESAAFYSWKVQRETLDPGSDIVGVTFFFKLPAGSSSVRVNVSGQAYPDLSVRSVREAFALKSGMDISAVHVNSQPEVWVMIEPRLVRQAFYTLTTEKFVIVMCHNCYFDDDSENVDFISLVSKQNGIDLLQVAIDYVCSNYGSRSGIAYWMVYEDHITFGWTFEGGEILDVNVDIQTGVITSTEFQLPPTVQAYVDQMQAILGHAYIVGAVKDGDAYRVTVNFRTREDCTPGGACPKVIFIPKPGQLTHMSFVVGEDGRADVSTLAVVFNTGNVSREDALNGVVAPAVDAQLLYAALIQLQHVYRRDRGTDPVLTALPLDRSDLAREDRIGLPEGPIDLEFPMAKIDKILIQMTQILVTAVTEDGAIHFVKDGMDYKCYRDAEGNVIVERELPPAVQALVDALNQSPYFKVSVNSVEGSVPAQYQFVVVNTFPCTDNYCVKTFPSSGSFSNMNFIASESGIVDAATLQAVYHGALFSGELFHVNGPLFFEGLKALALKNGQPVDMQVLALMTRIILTEVTASGKIRFNKDGIAYKIFRDESENVLLTRDIPGLPDNHFAAYLGDVADHFGISVDAIVEIYEFHGGAVCLGTGCPAWAIQVSLKAIVDGSETSFSGMVRGPAWDVPVKWEPVVAISQGSTAVSSTTVAQSDVVSDASVVPVIAPLAVSEYPETLRAVRSVAVAGSVAVVSNLLKAPVVAADSGTAETSAIFGFEQGSILFSKVLKALTK